MVAFTVDDPTPTGAGALRTTGGDSARPALATGLIAGLVAVDFLVHIVTTLITPYGFHRDEFLYLAMGKYLELWRMFFPPAIAVMANLVRAVFGDTLFAIRLLPAVAGALLVWLAALTARELGGGRAAQGLAAFAVMMSPVFLRAASLFQPVVFDQLWWTVGLFALIKLGQGSSARWWILLGLAGGLGLLTKFSIGFIGGGVLVGLAVSSQRRFLGTVWPYVTGLIALAIGSPSWVGQLRLGVPAISHLRILQHQQLDRLSPGDFVLGQFMMLGPAVGLGMVGLVYLLRASSMRRHRAVGWACLTAFLVLMGLRGKPYYIGPIYPVLFGAGAVALTLNRGRWLRISYWSLMILVAVYGILALPFGLPIVPPIQMARYAAGSGVKGAITTNTGQVLALPQDYADMLGWEEQVAAVARVFQALPAEQRSQTTILASNYGEAGALDFFGPRYGLPRAVSRAGGYWYFGPGNRPGEVAVGLGFEPEELRRFYRSVKVVERIDNPWGVPEQRNNPIVVAESPLQTLQEAWPSLVE